MQVDQRKNRNSTAKSQQQKFPTKRKADLATSIIDRGEPTSYDFSHAYDATTTTTKSNRFLGPRQLQQLALEKSGGDKLSKGSTNLQSEPSPHRQPSSSPLVSLVRSVASHTTTNATSQQQQQSQKMRLPSPTRERKPRDMSGKSQPPQQQRPTSAPLLLTLENANTIGDGEDLGAAIAAADRVVARLKSRLGSAKPKRAPCLLPPPVAASPALFHRRVASPLPPPLESKSRPTSAAAAPTVEGQSSSVKVDQERVVVGDTPSRARNRPRTATELLLEQRRALLMHRRKGEEKRLAEGPRKQQHKTEIGRILMQDNAILRSAFQHPKRYLKEGNDYWNKDDEERLHNQNNFGSSSEGSESPDKRGSPTDQQHSDKEEQQQLCVLSEERRRAAKDDDDEEEADEVLAATTTTTTIGTPAVFSVVPSPGVTGAALPFGDAGGGSGSTKAKSANPMAEDDAPPSLNLEHTMTMLEASAARGAGEESPQYASIVESTVRLDGSTLGGAFGESVKEQSSKKNSLADVEQRTANSSIHTLSIGEEGASLVATPSQQPITAATTAESSPRVRAETPVRQTAPPPMSSLFEDPAEAAAAAAEALRQDPLLYLPKCRDDDFDVMRQLPATSNYLQQIRRSVLMKRQNEVSKMSETIQAEIVTKRPASAMAQLGGGRLTGDALLRVWENVQSCVMDHVPPSLWFPSFPARWAKSNEKYSAFIEKHKHELGIMAAENENGESPAAISASQPTIVAEEPEGEGGEVKMVSVPKTVPSLIPRESWDLMLNHDIQAQAEGTTSTSALIEKVSHERKREKEVTSSFALLGTKDEKASAIHAHRMRALAEQFKKEFQRNPKPSFLAELTIAREDAITAKRSLELLDDELVEMSQAEELREEREMEEEEEAERQFVYVTSESSSEGEDAAEEEIERQAQSRNARRDAKRQRLLSQKEAYWTQLERRREKERKERAEAAKRKNVERAMRRLRATGTATAECIPVLLDIVKRNSVIPISGHVEFDMVVNKESYVLQIFCESELCGLKSFHSFLTAINVDKRSDVIIHAEIIYDLARDKVLKESPRLYNENELADFAEAKVRAMHRKEIATRREQKRNDWLQREKNKKAMSKMEKRGNRGNKRKGDAALTQNSLANMTFDLAAEQETDSDTDTLASSTIGPFSRSQRHLRAAARRGNSGIRSGGQSPSITPRKGKEKRKKSANIAVDEPSGASSPVPTTPLLSGRQQQGEEDKQEGQTDTAEEATPTPPVKKEWVPKFGAGTHPNAAAEKFRRFVFDKLLVDIRQTKIQEEAALKEANFADWKETRGNNVTRHAIVVCISEFEDNAIAPIDMAKSDAKAVELLLLQHGFTVDVMSPDANVEFLKPTAKNVVRLVRSVLQGVVSENASVVVYVVTRGVVAKFPSVDGISAIPPSTIGGAAVGNTCVVGAAFDTFLATIATRARLTPEMLYELSDNFGNKPLVFFEAWPMPYFPFAHISDSQPIGVGFGTVTARGSSNSQLKVVYPKQVGGMLTYYMLRALQGFAVFGSFSPDSTLTMGEIFKFLQPRLERRKCKVASNIGVAGLANSYAYFDFSFYRTASGQQLTRDFREKMKMSEKEMQSRVNMKVLVRVGSDVKPIAYTDNERSFWAAFSRAIAKVIVADKKHSVLAGLQLAPPAGNKSKKATAVASAAAIAATEEFEAANEPKIAAKMENYSKVIVEFRDATDLAATGLGISLAGGGGSISPSISHLGGGGGTHARWSSLEVELSRVVLQTGNQHEAVLKRNAGNRFNYVACFSAGRVDLRTISKEPWITMTKDQLIGNAHTKRIIRRPRNIFLEVNLAITCTARAARKVDRIARLQSIYALGVVSQAIVDPTPPLLHICATRLAAVFRGMKQFRQYSQQRSVKHEEEEYRTMISNQWFREVREMQCEYNTSAQSTLLIVEARTRREDVVIAEKIQFGDILNSAIRVQVKQEARCRFLLSLEQLSHVTPIFELMGRTYVEYQERVVMGLLKKHQRLIFNEIWSRFYIALDWYRGMLLLRSSGRIRGPFYGDIERPRPPCTLFDPDSEAYRSYIRRARERISKECDFQSFFDELLKEQRAKDEERRKRERERLDREKWERMLKEAEAEQEALVLLTQQQMVPRSNSPLTSEATPSNCKKRGMVPFRFPQEGGK